MLQRSCIAEFVFNLDRQSGENAARETLGTQLAIKNKKRVEMTTGPGAVPPRLGCLVQHRPISFFMISG